MRRVLAAAFSIVAAAVSFSAAAEDKSGYSLFDAVPERLLRPFNPDRPGLSHDPTTVDAGHVQIETGAVEHVYDPRGPGFDTLRRYIYANPTVRVGVTNDVELQIGAPLANLFVTGGSDRSRAAGMGDTTVALKANLLGNDGGNHVLAILPTIKLPTAARNLGNGYAEFLVSVPYNYALTRDLALTLEPSVGALRNGDNTAYRDSWGFILGLDQTIAKVFVASIEVAAQASTARGEATNWSVSPSLAWLVSKNVQLDVGLVMGLNKATPRYDASCGLSLRF